MCDVGAKPETEGIKALDAHAVMRVQEYIDAHVDEKIHIDQLADLVGVSQFHFSRSFKEATGMPPHQFIVQHRIRKIKDLLANPGLTLAEISYAAGFSSQSHMSTQFKKVVGVTPNGYRKEVSR